MKRRQARLFLLLALAFASALAVVFAGCTGDDPGSGSSGGPTAARGELGGLCFPNATCNAGLVCEGSVCVAAADGSTSSDDAGPTETDAGVDAAEDAAVDAPPLPPRSCVGLPKTCGPTANEDCCAALVVPGGTYLRSYDAVNDLDGGYPATIATFALDRFEVSVGRFRTFMNTYGNGTTPALGAGKNPNNPEDPGWKQVVGLPLTATELRQNLVDCGSTWTDVAGANETKPINCVSWYVAFAFCVWDRGRLPSEAEWNYAATGGGDAIGQRAYPWSAGGANAVSANEAVYGGAAIGLVGSKSPAGDGRWGHADLAGNVSEWVVDKLGAYPRPCLDCANFENGNGRVRRGGAAASDALSVRTGFRPGFAGEIDREVEFGLRCARKP